MSRERITEFFEKVESDKGLQAEIQRAAGENEKQALAQVVKTAAAAGFEFSTEEPECVADFPGLQPKPRASDCCYYAQGCMGRC
jgi:predicted ribosomally synthesized peptide with nif11-like leader